jgi:hypothetical protein
MEGATVDTLRLDGPCKRGGGKRYRQVAQDDVARVRGSRLTNLRSDHGIGVGILAGVSTRERAAAHTRTALAAAHLLQGVAPATPSVLGIVRGVTDASRWGIAMEHVDGRILGDVAVWSPSRACDLALAMADGVEHLHRHGATHLDLKPDNVILTPEGVCALRGVRPLSAEHLAWIDLDSVVNRQGGDWGSSFGCQGTVSFIPRWRASWYAEGIHRGIEAGPHPLHEEKSMAAGLAFSAISLCTGSAPAQGFVWADAHENRLRERIRVPTGEMVESWRAQGVPAGLADLGRAVDTPDPQSAPGLREVRLRLEALRDVLA